MTVKANALGLSGYRLPAWAEWELACRAGSVTTWSMGEAADLLPKYAWYVANSPGELCPTGRLRPNDLGLFDLHGNACEWCHDGDEDFTDMRGRNMDDKVDKKSLRALRGGAFDGPPVTVRSAGILWPQPVERSNHNIGFRPARTFH
jgi:formylglycine-generating enzyme required for sulfatase activity